MANRPDWLTARPIAHRGFHDATSGVIENTLSAVTAATQRNFAIEVDVQLSRDGEAMVYHDGNLARLTGHNALIDDLTVEQLQSLQIKGTSDRIPTLWDTLQVIDGRVPIFIEIKNDDPIRPDEHLVNRTLQVLSVYQGPAAVMSFDPGVVMAVKRLEPKLPRGIIADNTTDLKYYGHLSVRERASRRNLLHWFKTQPDFVAYRIKDLPAPGPAIARAFFNCPIMTWTVRTEQDRRRASTHADQIIFEGFNPYGG